MVRIGYPGCLPNVSNNGREAASKARYLIIASYYVVCGIAKGN
uniref:Uncharacterized protein n=1 Tax=Solanum lycopersicum TaxID=4081 RepID=A0A3Q7JV03_SOLLC